MPGFALQMTVSSDREFAEMEDKLEGVLAVLPESEQYLLIICTYGEFKMVGQRRLAAYAGKSTRMSRLSIFHMDMRTAHEPAVPALVPEVRKTRARRAVEAVDSQPAEPASTPKARKSKTRRAEPDPDPEFGV